jgi:hypothetical protein
MAGPRAAHCRMTTGVQTMIVTFQSRNSADVMMFGDVARHMMQLIGKEPADRGVVTVEDLPAAIARLKAAIAADKAARTNRPAGAQAENKAAADEREPVVGIAQRALPLLELLERSLKEDAPVLWGV